MAYSPSYQIVITLAILVLVFLSSSSASELSPHFHKDTCPKLLETVRGVVVAAIAKKPRAGASLLRLHFHDCLVNGCDASILLDDTRLFTGEKNAIPNQNYNRGFDVVDEIKSAVEEACPGKVSCADILAIAARDSVVLLRGPSWTVNLGRRDSKTASIYDANDAIPTKHWPLNQTISRFNALGLSTEDLVTLNGAHALRHQAQISSNKKLQLDNSYFTQEHNVTINSCHGKYLTMKRTKSVVAKYAKDSYAFTANFAKAMIKMGNIKPLTGSNGEIRQNCRTVN